MSLGLFGSRSPPEVEPVAQFGKGAERCINFPLSVTVSLLWHAHTLTPTPSPKLGQSFFQKKYSHHYFPTLSVSLHWLEVFMEGWKFF